MRLALLFLSLGIAIGSAGILTDPFNTPQNNCNYSATAPYSACDVIGAEINYDIQMASVGITGGTATVSLYFNSAAVTGSGNSMSLTSFTDASDTLVVGDLFFYDPSDPSATLKYGVPLENHGSFSAGDLYSISGNVGTETAEQALNYSSDYYRRDQTVLLTGSGNAESTGTVTIANYGDGTTNALFDVTVSFPTTSSFLNLVVNNQIGLLFSAADCGNDVIQGDVATDVPEPRPALLIAVGLALIAGICAWRKRGARGSSTRAIERVRG